MFGIPIGELAILAAAVAGGGAARSCGCSAT